MRARLTRVKKRDGREVPWDKRKIEAAVGKALAATGDGDASFAGEVADIVELALADRGAAAHPETGELHEVVPGIEEIQDLVERVLVELGRATVAKAYILYRDRRARARGALNARPPGEPETPARVRVREAAGTAPWDKARVVAALMDEAELPRTRPLVTARRPEASTRRSTRAVTSGLVRELVAGELLEQGLDAALLRQASVSLARHDLRRILSAPAAAAWDATALADRQPEALRAARAGAERVGAEVLERYVAEDVLGPGPSELHSAGDLEVVDLATCQRPLAVSIPAELLLEGEPGPDAPFRVLAPLGELLRGVGRTVVVEDPGPLLLPLVRSSRDRGAAGLGGLIAAWTGLARASGRAVGIGSPGPRHASVAGRLVEELAPFATDPFAPTLYFSGADIEAALSAGLEDEVERLLAAGRLAPTFGDEGRRCVGPGLHRLPRERGALACVGAVALNLPRLARRAGPWREELFLEALADLVRCAVEICVSLHAFQSALPGFLPPRLAARRSFALVPIGLREALRVLGDGELDPDRGARALGLLAEAARRFAPPGAPRIVPSAFFGDGARARLAWLDRRERAQAGGQRWLFADAELRREGGSAPGGAYAEGYGLSPVRGLQAGQAEADLVKTVVAGAFLPARAVTSYDALDPEARRPHLDAWHRFHDLVQARRAGREEPLFPAAGRAREGASLARETV